MARPLTAKQTRFIVEYLVDLNATQAAIRAGYSARTARQVGPENLSKPVIAAAIAAAQAERQQRTEVTSDWVIERLKVEAQDTDEYASHGARVKALELLGKHVGMWPNKLQVEGKVSVMLTLEQALQADRELEQWQQKQRTSASSKR